MIQPPNTMSGHAPSPVSDLSKFECLGCGTCCRQDGYVRLKADEADKIAAFLDMDIYEFIDAYTILTQDRQSLSLIDKKDGECIFLDNGGCRIHPVKPGQCLGFPHQWKFKAFEAVCAWAIRTRKNHSPSISSPSSSSK